MPFWRVYTDLFPRGRVDFERQPRAAYANVSFRGRFCSEVMHQHRGCGACAHALSILTGMKSHSAGANRIICVF